MISVRILSIPYARNSILTILPVESIESHSLERRLYDTILWRALHCTNLGRNIGFVGSYNVTNLCGIHVKYLNICI